MRRLEGRVALISGVARGQGRSHAVHLAREGAMIIGFDLMSDYSTVPFRQARPEDMEETVRMVEAVGGRILTSRADVRERSQIEEVVARGVAEFGPVDTVVANAGIGINSAPFWEVPQDEWRDCIDVNLGGVWNTVSAAVPSMIEGGSGGSIVLTSSAAAMKSAPNLAPYTAAKSGVVGMMGSMANDLAPYRIRVNTVCPTSVATDFLFNDRLYRIFRPDLSEPTIDDVRPVMASMHPLGEPWIDVDDVSAAVVYLTSDDARSVTGVVLPIDLGLSIKL